MKQDDISDLIGTTDNVCDDAAPDAAGELIPSQCHGEPYEIFAQAVARHGNKLAAYREAYPDAAESTARGAAYRLINVPDVARRVRELTKARRDAILKEAEDLEALVANLTQGKPARLMDDDGNLIPLHLLPAEVRDAIKGLKLSVTTDKEGNKVSTYEVTFPDPLSAMRLLAQLRGQLIDRSDVTSGGKPINQELLTPEQRHRVLARLAGEDSDRSPDTQTDGLI